ncbi:uncharacterized protein LOC126354979 [Schistocerca gregaria]|uniref:uncharacterized protein LOC126354979 n=1 Tax=Schistocerca gregaria TaxID=7010 RepID=UPI00211DFA49|nr:uncharacterized protein LOC126354979 [Schistocerca gregaria]
MELVGGVMTVALLVSAGAADTEMRPTAVLPPVRAGENTAQDHAAAGSVVSPLGLLGTAGSLGLLGPASPLLSSVVLSSLLGPAAAGYYPLLHGAGAGGLLPLLLAQAYGRYLPYGLGAYGLYGYSASNAVQNSKPFGAYKYEDRI